MNYKGYFNGLDNKHYKVELIGDSASGEYTEIMLAGDNPFTVQYNESSTPFDPLRTSVATINIVNNNYMEDILSVHAKDTIVKLIQYSGSNETTVWCGYLSPKIYDNSYENCWETISLNANDCLSTLQYTKYSEMNGRGITNIKDIIDNIVTNCGLLDGYYWTRSKKVGTSVLLPNQLLIPEQNFYFNDTDDSWTLQEVLEEICRYLGFTALQWGTRLYFIDYQTLVINDDVYATWYGKANGYTQGTATHLIPSKTIDGDSYRLNGATISFEPIYNKVVVNCNMNVCEDFIPGPFDDALLTNRNGDIYEYYEVEPEDPTTAKYPKGNDWLGQRYKDEDTDDKDYRYFHRVYDNKYWSSVYYAKQANGEWTQFAPLPSALKSKTCMRDYCGGTIVDLGVVSKNKVSNNQYIIPSKMDYTRYLCLSEKHEDGTSSKISPNIRKTLFKLNDGYKVRCGLSDKAMIVIKARGKFERYKNRTYINPDWTSNESKIKKNYAGQTKNGDPRLYFRLHIGDMGWSDYYNKWIPKASTYDGFAPTLEGANTNDCWNKEFGILNTISWELGVNEDGYKIPLSGVNIYDTIEFEVVNPMPAFYGSDKGETEYMEWNAYCWISDFEIKCVEPDQDVERTDSDVVYENIIDGDAVNELDDITVKITSFTDMTKPSYSNIMYQATSGDNPTFLTQVKEEALSNNPQKCEENIIEKYVYQYSTQTKKINLTLDTDIPPFQKIFAVDVDNQTKGYTQLGTSIDYRMGRQTMTYIEKVK